jgi:hypothetical protein
MCWYEFLKRDPIPISCWYEILKRDPILRYHTGMKFIKTDPIPISMCWYEFF